MWKFRSSYPIGRTRSHPDLHNKNESKTYFFVRVYVANTIRNIFLGYTQIERNFCPKGGRNNKHFL